MLFIFSLSKYVKVGLQGPQIWPREKGQEGFRVKFGYNLANRIIPLRHMDIRVLRGEG